MSAANRPVATGTPSIFSAVTNASYSGSATAGRAAAVKLGRRPPRYTRRPRLPGHAGPPGVRAVSANWGKEPPMSTRRPQDETEQSGEWTVLGAAARAGAETGAEKSAEPEKKKDEEHMSLFW